ncbi:dopamine beta-hydroxylase [Plakobranchus ocellatus]|uniref:Dopamine beta-hydroxylase n=1 Tax=Plakobranchus ocellatus TaxID=259542 RepID=A0AAV3YC45_9GAST|nr:dopamine beta-hydroxylase [Plakobranchus ocellatus]
MSSTQLVFAGRLDSVLASVAIQTPLWKGLQLLEHRHLVHYNNPGNKSGLRDKSGMRLYYQPATTDVQDMLTFTVGAQGFEIPPGKPRYEVSSVCNTSCRGVIKKPAKIVAATNHMHYLGIEMQIELFRCGQKKAVITHDPKYTYDNPQMHKHNPSIDLLPGDEIKTTCVYNSESKKRPVSFGEATSNEMCYGFLFAYPSLAIPDPYCVSNGNGNEVKCDEGIPETEDGVSTCTSNQESQCQEG